MERNQVVLCGRVKYTKEYLDSQNYDSEQRALCNDFSGLLIILHGPEDRATVYWDKAYGAILTEQLSNLQNVPETGQIINVDPGKISDGYHTFDELYEHRNRLYIALCKMVAKERDWERKVWRSLKHSDGSSYSGWFIMGIGIMPGWQITYHLPVSMWGDCDFAEFLEQAPEYDGHTSNDVLRLLQLL